ncbi:MAG: hypothetical protein ACPGQS_08335 [Bradymonadia bacterium]
MPKCNLAYLITLALFAFGCAEAPLETKDNSEQQPASTTLPPDVSNESQPGQNNTNNSTASSNTDVNQTENDDSPTNASTETNEQSNDETNVSCFVNADCAPGQICVDEFCREIEANESQQNEALAAQAERFNELCQAECEAIDDCGANFFSSVEECISIDCEVTTNMAQDYPDLDEQLIRECIQGHITVRECSAQLSCDELTQLWEYDDSSTAPCADEIDSALSSCMAVYDAIYAE